MDTIKFQTRGVPVHKGTQQLASLVVIQAGCSLCSPKYPINVRALSLGPRLSLFSEVGYYQYFMQKCSFMSLCLLVL